MGHTPWPVVVLGEARIKGHIEIVRLILRAMKISIIMRDMCVVSLILRDQIVAVKKTLEDFFFFSRLGCTPSVVRMFLSEARF